MTGDQAGETDAATIFEFKRHGAGNVTISEHGAGAIHGRRISKASATLRAGTLIMIERDPASIAAGFAKEAHAGPAFQAKAVVISDDHATTGTTRRECVVHHRANDRTTKIIKLCHTLHCLLVLRKRLRHKPAMSSALDIFDRRLRAMRRDRAARKFAAHNFLYRHMADELVDRLADVKRDLNDVLLVGCPDGDVRARLEAMGKHVVCTDPSYANARAQSGVQADEDALPFADESFDLIIACGTLDSVNDLPGALILMQRILRPDGLLLAAFVSAGSLAVLRRALMVAEGDRPGQHIHPQIDVRAAGDLLARAGFTIPVADGETLTVRYSGLNGLLEDLRGMAASNMLCSRSPGIGRETLVRAARVFADGAETDGKTPERFDIAYLSGWKPDASQPKPARRGSATVSLAAALKPKAL